MLNQEKRDCVRSKSLLEDGRKYLTMVELIHLEDFKQLKQELNTITIRQYSSLSVSSALLILV